MSEGLSHIEDTNFPSFTGDGHLEGNPSGNSAAENAYHIGKNMIENDLWKEGMKLIELKGSDINFNVDTYNFKIADYLPTYLMIGDSTPNYVLLEVRDYLKGNLWIPNDELPGNKGKIDKE